MNVHIAHYEEANRQNHETKRRRKLLLHRNEIGKWHRKVRQSGLTSVPLRMYFKGSHVKVEIALVKGKASYDKRATLRDRQDKLEMDRAMRNQNKD
jgi:SsrA-binding protein